MAMPPTMPPTMPPSLPASAKAIFDLHIETPPSRPHVSPARSGDATDEEELEITFNKTLAGHYRYGKTGYKRVGVLFLTWEEDDLQCKETEVDALRALFADEFKYETAYFQIPKERWQTALQKRIADFLYEFDSHDCLTIIYYGGHGYIGKETRSLKLAAKGEPDESGDPTLFMNDILGCCRLPTCDQLVILDCCFAANAFGREHVGKRKFEMIVSSGCEDKAPAPQHKGSFTEGLHQVLKNLLRKNKTGFATSQLYREIYHSIPQKPKPWLFDQAKRDYGRIWLRPQAPLSPGYVEPEQGSAYLNLTLKLNKEPDSVAMNQLALNLQYLPHIDQVRFDKLYAPRKQIENFMLYVQRASKLRPFVRKIHAKRRLKKLQALPQRDQMLQRPLSLMKLYMDQKDSLAFDWSSALDGHNPSPSSPVIRGRKKSFTWPREEVDSDMKRKGVSNRLFSLDYRFSLPNASSFPRFFPLRRAYTVANVAEPSRESISDWRRTKHQEVETLQMSNKNVFASPYIWMTLLTGEEVWHALMWLVLCYALWCFCYHVKE